MAILALLVLLPVLTLAIIGNQQIFNAYLVWAEKTSRLPVYNGETMPITWLITLDAALSVSCLAESVYRFSTDGSNGRLNATTTPLAVTWGVPTT